MFECNVLFVIIIYTFLNQTQTDKQTKKKITIDNLLFLFYSQNTYAHYQYDHYQHHHRSSKKYLH